MTKEQVLQEGENVRTEYRQFMEDWAKDAAGQRKKISETGRGFQNRLKPLKNHWDGWSVSVEQFAGSKITPTLKVALNGLDLNRWNIHLRKRGGTTPQISIADLDRLFKQAFDDIKSIPVEGG